MKIPTLLVALAAFAAAVTVSQPAAAQAYPGKPVRIIVPYQPGQGTDVATRFLAEALRPKPGGNPS